MNRGFTFTAGSDIARVCSHALMRIVHEAVNAFVTSIDWQTISDIGQAVGALGTVISALALVGVVHSLRLQHRQARASEEEVVRGMRNDLMLVALENEEYLPLWGFPHALSNREMTLHAYLAWSSATSRPHCGTAG